MYAWSGVMTCFFLVEINLGIDSLQTKQNNYKNELIDLGNNWRCVLKFVYGKSKLNDVIIMLCFSLFIISQ